MPMNPMQRRARNSFLIGFLVSLIIMALVVLALLYKIKSINEAKEALEALQVNVYVTAEDMKSGTVVKFEDLISDKVQTKMDESEVITSQDFEVTDENGEPLYNEDGTTVVKEMILKIDVPAGTIITKDMIVESGDKVANDQRIQEYNMILLPTQLKNGGYVDIRFQLPTGEDYIVLSKKRVLATNLDTIWLKLSEDEIVTIGNAIVEAWTIVGAKLYAIEYVEPGLQEAAISNYPVNTNIMNLIQTDPNIVQTAKQAIWDRYTAPLQNDLQNPVQQRYNVINPALSEHLPAQPSSVESGNKESAEKTKAGREAFVQALEGTGEIGTEEY